MSFQKSASILSLALVAGLAITGCSAPEPAATTTPSATRTPTEAPSGDPSSAPTTAPPEEWTTGDLTSVCIDFQGTWAEGEGLAADDFDWTAPATTQQDGDAWFVFLQGTITIPDGSSIPAEFTCVVTGTPGSPTVTESRIAD